jgi:hypothetical protein
MLVYTGKRWIFHRKQPPHMTFDDVMLDWAVAELVSPTWAAIWAGSVCDELRRKIQNSGIGSLSIHERGWLVGAVTQARSAIISVYGPCRSWSFRRTAVSIQELSAFSIIHHFGYPSFSFSDLATKIRDNPSGGEKRNARCRVGDNGSVGKR